MSTLPRRRLRPLVTVLLAALTAVGVLAIIRPAAAATGCSVSYTVTNSWTGNFAASFAITNLGDPITGWTLRWTWPSGQTGVQGWNGTYSQSGATETVTNLSYNGSIATGATLTGMGFNAQAPSGNTSPTSFTLNGVTCTGGSTASPSTSTTSPTSPTPSPSRTASPTPTPTATVSGFGFSNSGGFYTVNTGAGLIFKVNQSGGDLTSLKYNGLELQNQSRFSHIESGLGATVSAVQTGNYIVLTETTHTFYGSGTVLHYMVAHAGDNNIYMATYVDAAGAGEVRWYQSMNHSALPNTWTPSNTNGGTVIESQDILTVNGQTRSKYYSNRRAMDLTVRGITGNGVGVFMDYGNRESSSGGPFFRDIEQQDTGNTDLYNYLWSGHNDTETQRTGVLYGPYALMVTNGSTPAAPDLGFMYGFGFQGSVGPAGRGFVSGTETGVTAGNPTVVGWSNSTAQYWTVPASNGTFTSPAMKPGTYTQTLYQNELAVATRSVTVSAGATATGQNIASTWSTPTAIFRIGTWDGAPRRLQELREPDLDAPLRHPQRQLGPGELHRRQQSAHRFPLIPVEGRQQPDDRTVQPDRRTGGRAHRPDRDHGRVRRGPATDQRQRLDLGRAGRIHPARLPQPHHRHLPRQQRPLHLRRAGERLHRRHQHHDHHRDQWLQRDRVPQPRLQLRRRRLVLSRLTRTPAPRIPARRGPHKRDSPPTGFGPSVDTKQVSRGPLGRRRGARPAPRSRRRSPTELATGE